MFLNCCTSHRPLVTEFLNPGLTRELNSLLDDGSDWSISTRHRSNYIIRGWIQELKVWWIRSLVLFKLHLYKNYVIQDEVNLRPCPAIVTTPGYFSVTCGLDREDILVVIYFWAWKTCMLLSFYCQAFEFFCTPLYTDYGSNFPKKSQVVLT